MTEATSGQSFTLYARHEHGGHPVVVSPKPVGALFRVEWPTGPVEYPSARQLIRALYNQGNTSPQARDPGMSFERYFHLGKWAAPKEEVGQTVFDLFPSNYTPILVRVPKVVLPAPPVKPQDRCPPSAGRWYHQGALALGISTLTLFGSADLDSRVTVTPPIPVEMRWADPVPLSIPAPPPPVQAPTLTVDPKAIPVLGIDLERRYDEVRKLLFSGFGAKIARAGYEPEEVLQEVYKGLIARNRGSCRFDSRKSSFGHYVHMVCGCVLANYHRKHNRRMTHEQLGMLVWGTDEAEDGQHSDAALGAVDGDSPRPFLHELPTPESPIGEMKAIGSLQERLRREGERPEVKLAITILPLVFEGFSRSEIAARLEVDSSKVGRALSCIRRVAKGWGKDQGFAV